MGATNELRKLLRTELLRISEGSGIKEIYYQIADDEALYPHIVFNLDSGISQTMFLDRFNYELIVDIYYRNEDIKTIEDLCDDLQKELFWKNMPNTDILPTIYFERRSQIIEENKYINHRQLTFEIQMYERT